MNEKTIWVIDDDPIYQIIMKKIILKSGIFSSNSSFSNGKEAIDSLKKIILKKDKMPNIILGWGFMDEISFLKPQINTEIQIYISSSSIAIEDKERAKNNPGILGYMCKPVTLDDLIKIATT
ncbi:MAG: response regulator [Flavobacteriales bacterium 32-34-25]|nr:MAG: response regulator [Flavobacteriales bacterium 32-34-25]